MEPSQAHLKARSTCSISERTFTGIAVYNDRIELPQSTRHCKVPLLHQFQPNVAANNMLLTTPAQPYKRAELSHQRVFQSSEMYSRFLQYHCAMRMYDLSCN